MTTDGRWDLLLSPEPWCYPVDDLGFSYTLVSIRYALPGTLRKVLSPHGGINYDRLRGASIYVARVNKWGQTAMARPCDRCFELLRSAGVKDIVYTVDANHWRREWPI